MTAVETVDAVNHNERRRDKLVCFTTHSDVEGPVGFASHEAHEHLDLAGFGVTHAETLYPVDELDAPPLWCCRCGHVIATDERVNVVRQCRETAR